MKKGLFLLIANINHAYKKKIKHFNIEYSNVVVDFCSILVNLRIIRNIIVFETPRFHNHRVISRKFIRVFLFEFELTKNYNRNLKYSTCAKNILDPLSWSLFQPYNELELISKPSRIVHLSHLELCKQLQINSIKIILTKSGFLTDFQCVRLKLGGLVLCKISF